MKTADQQSGFVLVGAIGLTLIFLLIAGLLGVYADRQYETAAGVKALINDSLDQQSTVQTLIFLLATKQSDMHGLQAGGLNAIKLDGRHYQGVGEQIFSLNDSGGLVSVNSMANRHLERLLGNYESSALRRQMLMNALYDYIDDDDKARLNGKEAPAYRAAKMAPPANSILKSAQELVKVFGWSEWLTAHPDSNLQGWLTGDWRPFLNINTAPEALLLKVLPLNMADRLLLINRRNETPFSNVSDVNATLNMRARLDEDYFSYWPGNRFRLRLFSSGNNKLSTMEISFTPMKTSAPWEIEYWYLSERRFDIAESVGPIAEDYFLGRMPATEQ